MEKGGSFFDLMKRLRAGDESAATELFQRFTGRLIGLARTRLDARLRQKVDPEDVVQSVYRSFFRRQAEGEFDLDGWDDLWSLLTVITVRRCGHWREHYHADKRDVRAEVVADEQARRYGVPPESLARDPSPLEAAILADVVERLLSGLGERDAGILSLRLQGYQPGEISEQLNVPQRTVHRVLGRVKRGLQRLRGG